MSGEQPLSIEEKTELLQKIFSKEELNVITGALYQREWHFDERIDDLSNHNTTGINTGAIKVNKQHRADVQAVHKIFDGALFAYESLDKKPTIHEQLQAKPLETTVKNDCVKRNKGDVEL
jgi:hypothetical protein